MQSRLRDITQNLQYLEAETIALEARRSDPIWMAGIKYWLVTAVEACIDIAQHMAGSEGWRLPADNGDAMRVLAENGVLDPALADRMRMAVGFRNVVIHEYARVDERIVLERLADPSDLDLFVRSVSEWLAREAD